MGAAEEGGSPKNLYNEMFEYNEEEEDNQYSCDILGINQLESYNDSDFSEEIEQLAK